mmetsp:Transcript_22388/g.26567  ORF Transcript_22388/g.26567 Transcript_22388/m.26567 type:complete len:241 (-) Transcript_22388:715-1437(-)
MVVDAISSITGPISSSISGAVMERFFFINASLVARFVTQHPIQQAKTKSFILLSLSLEFLLVANIRFQATNVPIVPARISPMPPLRLRPPSSEHIILCVVELDQHSISSTHPFFTIITPSKICFNFSSEPSPMLSTRRLYSTTFGVKIITGRGGSVFASSKSPSPLPSPSTSKFRFSLRQSIYNASASRTNGSCLSFASITISATAFITIGHRPKPGPITNTCIRSIKFVTFSTILRIAR